MLGRLIALLVALALLLATADAVRLVTADSVGRSQGLRATLVLLVLAAAWVLVNAPVEGPVLWRPLPTHGLTLADVFAVPPVLLAGVLAVLTARS